MGDVKKKFGRPLSAKLAPFFDRISSVGRNHRGLLTWMASCATDGCSGELPLEMLRRHGNQVCNECKYAVVFGEGLLSKKLENEKHRVVAVSKIKGVGKYWVKDWWMRCGQDQCMNVFRCYEFVRHGINFCTMHRRDFRCKRMFEASFNYARCTAAVRKKPWLLSYEEFSILCKLPQCFFCQRDLNRLPEKGNAVYRDGGKVKTKYVPLLDRVDNSQGYIVGNVVPCCAICNCRKNARRTADQLLRIIAEEQKDAKRQQEIAAGTSWKQIFVEFCAGHLIQSEVETICP